MGRAESFPSALKSLSGILERGWPHLIKQRLVVASSLAALVAHSALKLLEPWPLKFLVDLLTGYEPGWARSIASSTAPLLICASAIPVIAGLSALANYASTVGFAVVGNRVLTNIRAELFRHLQTLSPATLSRERIGDLVIRVVGDVGMLRDVVSSALLPLVAHSLIFVGLVAVMLWLDWKLTLVALSITPLFLLVSTRLNRRIHSVAREQRRREGALATTAAESIGAMPVVQSLALEDRFADQFSQQNEKGFKEGVRGKRLAAGLERSVDVLVAISTGVAIGYGAFLVKAGVLTPGDLVIFYSYLRRAFRPVKDFAKYSARVARAAAAGERVLSVFAIGSGVQERTDAVAAPRFAGRIEFANLSYAYGGDQPALTSVSADLGAGQYTAIVGPAGSGKSTLMGLILRLHDPQSGEIRVDGQATSRYTLASLRNQIGVVMQDTVLFAGTVGDNISLGSLDPDTCDIDRAIETVGCQEFIESLPNGLATDVGERGVTLSPGQRQLISLCRMAARDVSILILDEPTSSLDRENQSMVFRCIERLRRGRSTLLVTHDLERAQQADWILRLEAGRIAAQGTHAELMARDLWYAEQVSSHSAAKKVGT